MPQLAHSTKQQKPDTQGSGVGLLATTIADFIGAIIIGTG